MIDPFSFISLEEHFQENLRIIRKSVKKDNFLNSLINPIYSWLESMILTNGAIYDKYVKSTLDHQYHIPWFILSSSILYAATNENHYEDNILRTFRYLSILGYEVNKRSNSFIGIPLILSICFINDDKIKNQVKDYINAIEFMPPYGSKSANNFHCLKMTALFLKEKILLTDLDSNELNFIENIAYKKLPEWQYNDGFFYDKPYNKNELKGIPHLTYHATITMCTILSSILLGDDKLFARGDKALRALEYLVSPAGESGAYGRSNNAIFGYSSTIFAITLHQYFSQSDDYKNLRITLLKQIDQNMCYDGHLYIVPNKFEKKRAGFDQYMFVTVYNSWSVGLLLLSHLIRPINE